MRRNKKLEILFLRLAGIGFHFPAKILGLFVETFRVTVLQFGQTECFRKLRYLRQKLERG